ncbi:MAG: DEAD/DEAH box helicase [Candidatus Hadarchaeota archaeon]
MGEAEPRPFVPSPFQSRALQSVMVNDTMVVAPTGSGKTWIAEQAIADFLSRGQRSWYTTPLKALSNQKYDRFRKLFGEDNVGLLTGERRENPHAPVIVATTEILRNSLYSGAVDASFIVLDEAHYIAETERGVTWEEVIIFTPPESRLLLLSATIANAEELVGWMKVVRGKKPTLILVGSEGRPVPLRYGILDRFGRALPLDVLNSLPNRKARQLLWRDFNPVQVVRMLQQQNLLPAIIFLPRRRDCDQAARMFRGLRLDDGLEDRGAAFSELAKSFPHIKEHQMARQLIDAGVAPHHAGHMTAWKISVERMLREGLVQAVFATTTLAAGLDVPARTVVLPTLWVGDRTGERPLTALEFHQMTGRAGRRGKDKVGFVLVVPQAVADLRQAIALAESEPEELMSAFRIQYYQVLNLLASRGYEEALKVVDKSFAFYQTARRSHRRAQFVRQRLANEFKQRAALLRSLGYLGSEWTLTDDGDWGVLIRHEKSLLIMEAVRRGLMDDLPTEVLAGWAAALMIERAPRFAVAKLDLNPIRRLAFELDSMERRHKIATSGFAEPFEGGRRNKANLGAAAVYAWAGGKMDWRTLVATSGSEEGDMQRLISQTAEVLRQLEDLPLQISEKAGLARLAIMRYPVGEPEQGPEKA